VCATSGLRRTAPGSTRMRDGRMQPVTMRWAAPKRGVELHGWRRSAGMPDDLAARRKVKLRGA
jgi:hypothetical protein